MHFGVRIHRKYIISFVFVISFLLNDYNSGIPGIKLGELLLVLLSTYSIACCKHDIDGVTRHFIQFYVLCLMLSIVSVIVLNITFSMVSFVSVFTRWIRYGAHMGFLVSCNCLDEEATVTTYMKVSILMSIYMVAQFVSYYLFHMILPAKILPFFTWDRVSDTVALGQIFSMGYFRSYGFMAEPGYSVAFLLPALAISLSFVKEKKRIRNILIIGVGLITAISLQAVAAGVITVVGYCFFCMLKSKKRIKKSSVIIVVLGVVACIWFINSKYSAPIFGRLSSISSLRSGGGFGSTTLRLFRGYSVYGALPFADKIIGVGLGNIGNAIQTYQITTIYDMAGMSDTAIEYVNGIASILISSGLVGMIAFIIVIANIWRNVGTGSKIIVLQFITLMFAGMGVFQIEVALYFGLVIFINRIE